MYFNDSAIARRGALERPRPAGMMPEERRSAVARAGDCKGSSCMGLRVMPSLPELTAQQQDDVRQACGFACVRCGVTIYRYLRLPESHGVTLLCPTCHGLVEEGRLTPMQVQGFPANPVVRQRHFARDRLTRKGVVE